LATLLNIVFFTGMTCIFAISTVVGLTLNAEYFNPIIALIVTLIAYFWKNWKYSVEAECLELKTSIIEVCKEKAPKEDEQNSENPSANINTENNNEQTHSPLCSFVPCTCKSPNNPPSTSNASDPPNNPPSTSNASVPPDNPSSTPNTSDSPNNPPIMSPDGQANIPMVDISASKQTQKASTDQKVEDFATKGKGKTI
jgi:hypothetical protein